MNKPPSDKSLELTLIRIADAALQGARCPTNDQLPAGALRALARRGDVLVEVYIHNFRRVTILSGAHAGQKTASPPLHGGRHPYPYLTVSAEGTRRNGRLLDSGAHSRQGPSKPRDIGAAREILGGADDAALSRGQRR